MSARRFVLASVRYYIALARRTGNAEYLTVARAILRTSRGVL